MSSESPRERLPFEPRQKKKKPAKTAPDKNITVTDTAKKTTAEDAKLSAIPEVVSRRMLRRMALFAGIPSILGISSLFLSYWIVSQDWFKLPTVTVLLVSMGLFGLGVLGLSYGVLSASWDEERTGGWWGWDEFTLNFGRMVSAWRESRKEVRGEVNSEQ